MRQWYTKLETKHGSHLSTHREAALGIPRIAGSRGPNLCGRRIEHSQFQGQQDVNEANTVEIIASWCSWDLSIQK